MVEGARLESVYRRNPIEGSNPSLSAFAHRSFSVGGLHFILATADTVRMKQEKFFVYILQNINDFSFYVGFAVGSVQIIKKKSSNAIRSLPTPDQ